jgi:hypothetical protein
LAISFILFFFVVLTFELRAYTLSHSTSPFFCMLGIFFFFFFFFFFAVLVLELRAFSLSHSASSSFVRGFLI